MSAGAGGIDFVGAMAGAWTGRDINGVKGVGDNGSDTETEGDGVGFNNDESHDDGTNISTFKTDVASVSSPSGVGSGEDSQVVGQVELSEQETASNEPMQGGDGAEKSQAGQGGEGVAGVFDGLDAPAKRSSDAEVKRSGEASISKVGGDGAMPDGRGKLPKAHELGGNGSAGDSVISSSASLEIPPSPEPGEVSSPPTLTSAAAGSSAAGDAQSNDGNASVGGLLASQNHESCSEGSVHGESEKTRSAAPEAAEIGEIVLSAKADGAESISVDSIDDAHGQADSFGEVVASEQSGLDLFMESLPPGFVRCPGCPMVSCGLVCAHVFCFFVFRGDDYVDVLR